MCGQYLTMGDLGLKMHGKLSRDVWLLYFRCTVCVLSLLSIFVLTGCGVAHSGDAQYQPMTQGPQSERPSVPGAVVAEEQLKLRVEARWAAVVKRDFERAYQYESPGYRDLYSLERYKGRFGGQVGWVDARVAKLAIEGTSAKVVVTVQYKAMVPFNLESGSAVAAGETALDERWILDGGIWYHLPR
jgi:hypothetical protein